MRQIKVICIKNLIHLLLNYDNSVDIISLVSLKFLNQLIIIIKNYLVD